MNPEGFHQTPEMKKGQQTKANIVAVALEMAARDGLEGLTIGALAERTSMSKSGVFAHFGSREDLQLAVLKAYEVKFIDEVLTPSLQLTRGLARFDALAERWLAHTARDANSGCILVTGAFEYHGRPGAVRDRVVQMVNAWQQEVGIAIEHAVQTGELRDDVDVDDLVFGLNGIVLAVHHDARLLEDSRAFERGRSAYRRLLSVYLTDRATLLLNENTNSTQ